MNEFETMDASERAEHARWRAALYGLASRTFLQEPSDEELKASIVAAQAALEAGEGWTLPCERELLVHLASFDAEEDALGTRVRSEYAELFVGPRPPLAPLYESMYVGYPRRLLSETTKRVRDAYERCGLSVAKRNRVPDDHLGYELEFMAALARREAEALEAADEETAKRWQNDQGRFLEEHLRCWIELFCDRLHEAPGDYYGGWADFVRSFMAEDAAALASRAAR
ncbi:molecular chaperone TorD family protein [Adlercreutzia sp. R25]|uniref:Molecular chaperone TorD family protein n=1 Tax=Adlercreutzia shanghongiae TaxID=3111773 RepID=A0ABU6IVS9_9ACTN|nr:MULTISPECIES: molecular chaperone TorD family protein [unclassified Adlercreutzia]MEC4272182.1 molecular chaperone TorD family protein [Adlercreutzia sp. R25]MEC4293905.1 molecular chaperone TorD family protein [Adlercreutzia sp. R22]